MLCKGLPDEHDRAPRSVKRNQRCLDRCDAHLTSEMGQKTDGRDIQVMSVPTPVADLDFAVGRAVFMSTRPIPA
jgi:hypothetical protein